jgi:UDP-N-acetylglucosamine 2-epimerase (non-hydrolysing)
MRVTAVVGARPNFMKAAALWAELETHDDIERRLVHTGQHYDPMMSDAFFADLKLPQPDVNLGVNAESPIAQTAEIMLALEPVLAADPPDVLVVVGDVNSTLASALVGNRLGIRLAHVEAGLRSWDRTMPEEINRILTDAIADDCFTTEPSANENLRREGVAPERIHYVGNVMIDTLFRFRALAGATGIVARLGLRPREYAVLTLHRPANVDGPDVLATTLGCLESVSREVPIIFPVHPRTRHRLQQWPAVAALAAGLRLVEPLPYLPFVQLMADAACVLTDSGGIQEETTALGVPCLTLRTTTERPVTVTHGTNRIVGTSPDAVRTAWAQIRRGTWPAGRAPELWDGKAAQRIVGILRGAMATPGGERRSAARGRSSGSRVSGAV